MNRIATISLIILFTIFSPFAVMWCAYFLTAKALNMHEVFSGEVFWSVTGFWWIIGGGLVIARTIGDPNGKSAEEALEGLKSIERRIKYYEDNKPTRKH